MITETTPKIKMVAIRVKMGGLRLNNYLRGIILPEVGATEQRVDLMLVFVTYCYLHGISACAEMLFFVYLTTRKQHDNFYFTAFRCI